jgi:hypothetical protein
LKRAAPTGGAFFFWGFCGQVDETLKNQHFLAAPIACLLGSAVKSGIN